jgi:hypothetical protein
MLHRLSGFQVKLRPIATSLGGFGQELGRYDDWWRVLEAEPGGVVITHPVTGHFHTLLADQIHNFNEHQPDGQQRRALLELNVQLFLRGQEVLWERTRPGQDLPYATRVDELVVDFEYPIRSGLQAEIEANGGAVAWARESQLQRRLDEGAQIFLQEVRPRELASFFADSGRERLVLIWWAVRGHDGSPERCAT